MPRTFYSEGNEFAVSSGSNVNVTSSYSYFDHPPNSTANLTITSNEGDADPTLFEIGETYDLSWTGHGGGSMDDAVVIHSDYLGPGEGAIVFEGTNSNTGETHQVVWTPGFDLEGWYWDNGGSPSNPNAFWTSDQNSSQTVELPCYAPGNLILTERGEVRVERLTTADRVATVDRGLQPVLWTKSGDQALDHAGADAKPVLIKAGALGGNQPARDLIVSPQHRLFVGANAQLRGVFASEAFVPAKSLTGLPGIRFMSGRSRMIWVHFACARHEIVSANGCMSESLLLGPMVVNGLGVGERVILADIFRGDPAPDAALNGPPARKCLRAGTVRRWISRHRKAGSRLAA